MQKKCKICIKNHEIVVNLKNTITAELIWKSLPISSDANLWGEEVYFYINLSSVLEVDAKDVISFGEIAYWPSGKAIAIGYGKTPISKSNEIRLADRCNIWGETKYDLKKLKDIEPGEKIEILKC
jgi:hypothetical protein